MKGMHISCREFRNTFPPSTEWLTIHVALKLYISQTLDGV